MGKIKTSSTKPKNTSSKPRARQAQKAGPKMMHSLQKKPKATKAVVLKKAQKAVRKLRDQAQQPARKIKAITVEAATAVKPKRADISEEAQ